MVSLANDKAKCLANAIDIKYLIIKENLRPAGAKPFIT